MAGDPLDVGTSQRSLPKHPAVWLALYDMAIERKSSVVTPTRKRLADLAAVSVNRVTMALGVLEQAEWIAREHVPVYRGNARSTLLRIVLRRDRKAVATATGSRRAVATGKRLLRGEARRPESGCYGDSAVATGKRLLTSPTEKGAAPPLRCAAACLPQNDRNIPPTESNESGWRKSRRDGWPNRSRTHD